MTTNQTRFIASVKGLIGEVGIDTVKKTLSELMTDYPDARLTVNEAETKFTLTSAPRINDMGLEVFTILFAANAVPVRRLKKSR